MIVTKTVDPIIVVLAAAVVSLLAVVEADGDVAVVCNDDVLLGDIVSRHDVVIFDTGDGRSVLLNRFARFVIFSSTDVIVVVAATAVVLLLATTKTTQNELQPHIQQLQLKCYVGLF